MNGSLSKQTRFCLLTPRALRSNEKAAHWWNILYHNLCNTLLCAAPRFNVTAVSQMVAVSQRAALCEVAAAWLSESHSYPTQLLLQTYLCLNAIKFPGFFFFSCHGTSMEVCVCVEGRVLRANKPFIWRGRGSPVEPPFLFSSTW